MAEDRYLDPTREAFDAFKALPRDVPIQMLNLLRFHESAQYPADHPNAGKGWSGARAYQEYGKTSGPIFERVGGLIIWRGQMECMVALAKSTDRTRSGEIPEWDKRLTTGNRINQFP